MINFTEINTEFNNKVPDSIKLNCFVVNIIPIKKKAFIKLERVF